jgi:hypothetical protein
MKYSFKKLPTLSIIFALIITSTGIALAALPENGLWGEVITVKDGKVGIGTKNPGGALEIHKKQANGNAHTQVYISSFPEEGKAGSAELNFTGKGANADGAYIDYSINNGRNLHFRKMLLDDNNDEKEHATVMTLGNGGNVGINSGSLDMHGNKIWMRDGSMNVRSPEDYHHQIFYDDGIHFKTNKAHGKFRFSGGVSVDKGGITKTVMIINTQNERVGIGTPNPRATLEVHGKAWFSRDFTASYEHESPKGVFNRDNATVSISEHTIGTGRKASIQFHNAGYDEGVIELERSPRRMVFRDNQGHGLGIETTGGGRFRDIAIGDCPYAACTVGNNHNVNYETIQLQTRHNLRFRFGPNERMVLFNDGRLNTAGLVNNSDKRLKKDITTIKSSLDKITQLRGVNFRWKENNRKDVGFIAQEVEKIFPELVSEGMNNMKGVNYSGIIAPLVEAVKEQQEQIETQEERIQKLENIILEMKK